MLPGEGRSLVRVIGREAAAIVLAAVVRHGHGDAAAVACAAAIGLAPVLDHLRVEPDARHLRHGFLGVHADTIGRDVPRLEGGASRAWTSVRALVDKDTIAVLPVLRPDAIETYADPSGAIKIVSGDELRLAAPPEHGDSEATPVSLLVPPPAKLLKIPLVDGADNAWAYQPVLVNFLALRIPRGA